MLDLFNINFKEGALLSFLIISGEVKFIRILARYCLKKQKELTITEQNKRSFLYALKTGRSGVVEPLLSYFPHTFGKQLKAHIFGNQLKAKRAPVADEQGTIHPQNIIIRYGSAKYGVLIKPERKMGRVMGKLAKMIGKQVDKLVFKVETSGQMFTGEEIMRELVGEVIIVQNV